MFCQYAEKVEHAGKVEYAEYAEKVEYAGKVEYAEKFGVDGVLSALMVD